MILFICQEFSLMASDAGFASNYRARFWWPQFGLIHAPVNAWGKLQHLSAAPTPHKWAGHVWTQMCAGSVSGPKDQCQESEFVL